VLWLPNLFMSGIKTRLFIYVFKLHSVYEFRYTPEATCSLFTELPRRLILGNRYSYARIAYSRRRQMQVNICLLTDLPGPNQPPIAGCGEAPYACSASFREEFFSETG
jgi:hypothetical protein